MDPSVLLQIKNLKMPVAACYVQTGSESLLEDSEGETAGKCNGMRAVWAAAAVSDSAAANSDSDPPTATLSSIFRISEVQLQK